MKQIIKIKLLDPNCHIDIKEKGDWIDLKTRVETSLHAPIANTLKRTRTNGTDVSTRDVEFNNSLIPLGVAMKLPKGMEAHVIMRSSSFFKYGVIQTNAMGIIDNSYCGDDDEWMLGVVATKNVVIPAGINICQFKIVPSQKATWWQKLMWGMSNGVKIEYVDCLHSDNRGGFGTTGD